MSLALTSDRP